MPTNESEKRLMRAFQLLTAVALLVLAPLARPGERFGRAHV